jgi:hypothetical protein
MKKLKRKDIQIEPQVIIGCIDNGWVVEYPAPNADGNIQEAVTYEEDYGNDCLNRCKSLKKLLWLVREGLAEYYNDHNKYNVDIIIRDIETDKEIEE